MSNQRVPWVGIGGAAIGLAAALAFAATFPAVEGLGTKVRLPVFHGAMTWVNLIAFVALAGSALLSLLSGRDVWYRWAEALRWIAIPMWLIGTVLGLLAALNTWDFTGSKASRLSVITADPRLMAQFWILVAGVIVIAAMFVLKERFWHNVLDIAFVATAWGLIARAILGPGRALHPDSPVVNSDEIKIKLLFIGMVISIAVSVVSGAWAIVKARTGAPIPE